MAGVAFVHLGSSGQTEGPQLPWFNGFARNRYGLHKYWVMFNINPYDMSVVVSKEDLYRGQGKFWKWHLFWE